MVNFVEKKSGRRDGRPSLAKMAAENLVGDGGDEQTMKGNKKFVGGDDNNKHTAEHLTTNKRVATIGK